MMYTMWGFKRGLGMLTPVKLTTQEQKITLDTVNKYNQGGWFVAITDTDQCPKTFRDKLRKLGLI